MFIASLSGGDDPDSYIKSHGPEKFRELLNNAIPFFSYLLNELKSKIDITTPQGKRQLCYKVFPLIAKFDDDILRGGYVDQLADFVSTDRNRLEFALKEFIAKESRKEKYKKSSDEIHNKIKLGNAEVTLIATILSNDDALKFASENLDIEYIDHPVAHELIKRMYNESRNGEWRGPQAFIDEISDDDARLITGIMSESLEGTEDKWRRIIEDCKNVLYNKAYSAEINNLRELLVREMDDSKRRDLQLQINSYQKEKRRHGRIKKITIKHTI